jgi:hypothetical protein
VKRPHRRALPAASAALLLPALASCAVFSPTTTQTSYAPADGVSAQVGTVAARNLLIVGNSGSDALLSGALVNEGSSAESVSISTEGLASPVTVNVPPGTLVELGSETGQTSVVIGDLKAKDGALTPVTLSTPSGGQVSTQVPIALPEGPFATVTPTAD